MGIVLLAENFWTVHSEIIVRTADRLLMRSWRERKMNEIRLRECPFCKGKAYIRNALYISFWVKCSECYAETGTFQTEQEAAEAWNRRAGEQNER